MEKLFNLDYSRVEVTADARRRSMKLWSSTAIGPQRSRCSKIGPPEVEKMPTLKKMGTFPFSPYLREKRDCPLFRRICKVSADLMNNSDSGK